MLDKWKKYFRNYIVKKYKDFILVYVTEKDRMWGFFLKVEFEYWLLIMIEKGELRRMRG